VGYGLCCNLADLVTLEDSLASQYFKLLPLGGMIRTVPRAIRQLSKGFYGVGCPDPGVECLIGQVGKLLMHFGCPSNLGEKLKISYMQLVVELGLSEQPALPEPTDLPGSLLEVLREWGHTWMWDSLRLTGEDN
jgi:hypothetical protein